MESLDLSRILSKSVFGGHPRSIRGVYWFLKFLFAAVVGVAFRFNLSWAIVRDIRRPGLELRQPSELQDPCRLQHCRSQDIFNFQTSLQNRSALSFLHCPTSHQTARSEYLCNTRLVMDQIAFASGPPKNMHGMFGLVSKIIFPSMT